MALLSMFCLALISTRLLLRDIKKHAYLFFKLIVGGRSMGKAQLVDHG